VSNPLITFNGCVRTLAVAVALTTLSGCSWFGGSPKKLTDLGTLSANSTSVAWSSSVGKSAGYMFVPAFADKLIYTAAHDGTVTSLADEGGRLVTRIDAKARLVGGVGASENMVVVATNKGDVLAFDSAGRPLWKSQIAGEALAPPVVASAVVIVRTSDGRMIALDRADGKRKWVYQRPAPALTLRTNAGMAITRGTVYAGFPGGKMVAVETETGKPIWEGTISLPRGATELERVADVSGVPAVDDSRICAGVYQGRTGCLEALSGNVVWARDISSADAVTVDDKNLYVSATDGNIYALDKTSGSTVWKQEKLTNREPGAPLVVKGRVLVGDKDGTIHALALDDGRLVGRINTDGSRVVSLLPFGERGIVQTEKGGVYAINVN
jgi:outer membrane protein assembly factor BamB